MKVNNKISAALCAVAMCGSALTAVAQTEQPGLKSITAGDGWTVYDGGVYRYGPIMELTRPMSRSRQQAIIWPT